MKQAIWHDSPVNTTTSLQRRRRLTRAGLAVAALGALGCAAGCAEPLFPDDLPRSPFERYMVLRGEERPAKQTSDFGRQQPALRQRLTPLAD